MANLYNQPQSGQPAQAGQPLFPAGSPSSQDLTVAQSGFSKAFGPFLKYAWPIILVIIVGITLAALVKTKSSGGAKDKDKGSEKSK